MKSIILWVSWWHHILVSLKVLAQKVFIGALTYFIKCISEKLSGATNLLWLVDVWLMGCEGWAAHSPDIHQSLHHKAQEQLAFQWLIRIKPYLITLRLFKDDSEMLAMCFNHGWLSSDKMHKHKDTKFMIIE